MTSQRPLLKVAAETWMPWTIIGKDETNNLTVGGPLGDIMRVLAKYMRFDYELVQPPDGQWGIRLPDGNWTGMIGMVLRGEADFALGPFIVSEERQSVVDFTRTVYFDGMVILTQRPTLQSDVLGLVNVFSYQVWALVFLSIAAVVLSMVFIEKVEGKLRNNPTQNILTKSLIWPVKSLAQETSEWLPKGHGGRVLAATWLLASLIFTSCYSGVLTAMLTAPKVTIPIDSLEDLVTQTKTPWKLLTGSFLIPFLKDSSDPFRRKAYYESSGTIPDCWYGREAVARGEYAAWCGEMTTNKAISWDFSTTGRCHLYKARKRPLDYSLPHGMIFNKNSSYLEDANRIIYWLRESGIIDHWIRGTIPNTTLCMRPPTDDKAEGVAALNIEAYGGSFIIIVFGLLFSLMAFISELAVFHLS